MHISLHNTLFCMEFIPSDCITRAIKNLDENIVLLISNCLQLILFRRLNAELEAKTAELVREAEKVMVRVDKSVNVKNSK